MRLNARPLDLIFSDQDYSVSHATGQETRVGMRSQEPNSQATRVLRRSVTNSKQSLIKSQSRDVSAASGSKGEMRHHERPSVTKVEYRNQ